jgi:hypothetical protein
MHSRFVSTLAVVGVTLVGALTYAAPASASVRFDPDRGTGFVDGGDVRTPFRWSAAMLRARAAGVTFSHRRSIEDTYSVVCGWNAASTGHREHLTIVVTHVRESSSLNLRSSVAYDASTATAADPKGRVVGFRLTGAISGVSGTSVGPTVGAPCPDGRSYGETKIIDRVRLKSTATISALAASYRSLSHDLLVTRG